MADESWNIAVMIRWELLWLTKTLICRCAGQKGNCEIYIYYL